jgi:NADP-dependent 3-hydroxy acid dehydrogenase YdfG
MASKRKAMSNHIEGKVVVITGASKAMGEATAWLLSAWGADVVLGARRINHIQALADKLTGSGSKILAVATDVTYCDPVKTLVDAAVPRYRFVEVMLNHTTPRTRCGPARRMKHVPVQGKRDPQLVYQFERFGK